MNMLHEDVIQKVIDYKKAKTYMEIDVDKGDCCFKIKAQKKIAIDPCFNFTLTTTIKKCIKNPRNIFNTYYSMTSDEFFKKSKANQKVDIVFIDGLHEYRQVLRDVDNCFSLLNEEGVILLHDCVPATAKQAMPHEALEKHIVEYGPWTGPWMGDVWKAIIYLRSVRKDVNVFVLNCDSGIGIVTRGSAKGLLSFSREEISELTYKDLDENRETYLNLKEPSYLDEWLKS